MNTKLTMLCYANRDTNEAVEKNRADMLNKENWGIGIAARVATNIERVIALKADQNTHAIY